MNQDRWEIWIVLGVVVAMTLLALTGLLLRDAIRRRGGQEAAAVIIPVAWIAFAVAYALPSYFDFATLSLGWECAHFACSVAWEALTFRFSGEWYGAACCVLWVLGNVMFWPLPFWVLACRTPRRRWVVFGLMTFATVSTWTAPLLFDTEGLLIGYYVWSAAFLVAAVGFFLFAKGSFRAREGKSRVAIGGQVAA